MQNVATEYKGITYSAAQVAEMRSWLQELDFADMTPAQIGRLDCYTIVKATARAWSGGLQDFCRAMSASGIN